MMALGLIRDEKLKRILHCGWHGKCPQCAKASMFDGWLKLVEKCPECGLDYRFAHADDGPAFFALCITAFPLVFVAVWLAHTADLFHLAKGGGYALELQTLYFVGAVAIALLGPGRYAVRPV